MNIHDEGDSYYPDRGVVKLFGVAGAGKTRELQRIAKAWVDAGLALDQLIAVSFTRVGARTLVSRITDGQRTSQDDLRYCRTLHSLCYRLLGLQRSQVVTDKDLAGFFAGQHIMYEPEDRNDPDNYSPQPVSGVAGNHLLAFLSWCRNRQLDTVSGSRLYRPTSELLPYWTEERLQKFAWAYYHWKEDAGLYDFTDMLEMALQNGDPPEGGKVLIVDEVQDCTALQMRLIEKWSKAMLVTYLAGDDDQSLYGFLGAAPSDFLSYEGESFILPVNHRSTRAVVEYSARIIGRNKERQPKDLQAVRDGGSVTTYGLLSHLEKLPLERSSFILGRTRRVLSPIQAQLEDLGVPFTVRHGAGGLPDPQRAGIDYRAFRAVQALREGRQVTLAQLSDLYQSMRGSTWTVRGWKKKLVEMAAAEGGDGAPVTLVGTADLGSFGGTLELQNAVDGDTTEFLEGIDQWKRNYWQRIVGRFGADTLYKKPPITVSTIHGVKGDEADDVYVVPDVPFVVMENMQYAPGHEAERRVMYVAASRAKDNLHVLRPTTTRHYTEMLDR